MALMAALIPAALTVPSLEHHQVHYATIGTVSVQTVSAQQVAQNGRAL